MFVAIPAIIMRAIFAHGAFDRHAADLAAIGLMAYGVGLPAMALVRIVASTFYARHDTDDAGPHHADRDGRATSRSSWCSCWGFGCGIAGIALGTALGAWINVALLVMRGRGARFACIVNREFRRALPAILLAGAVAAVGARIGAGLTQQWTAA